MLVNKNKERKVSMIQEYKSKTNLFILLGIAAQIVGGVAGGTLSGVLNLAGVILFVVGCCYYAKGKGYHGAFGLFGILSILGLLVLICMKDKCKAAGR